MPDQQLRIRTLLDVYLQQARTGHFARPVVAQIIEADAGTDAHMDNLSAIGIRCWHADPASGSHPCPGIGGLADVFQQPDAINRVAGHLPVPAGHHRVAWALGWNDLDAARPGRIAPTMLALDTHDRVYWACAEHDRPVEIAVVDYHALDADLRTGPFTVLRALLGKTDR